MPPRVVPCIQVSRRGCVLWASVNQIRDTRPPLEGSPWPRVMVQGNKSAPGRWHEARISPAALRERLNAWGGVAMYEENT